MFDAGVPCTQSAVNMLPSALAPLTTIRFHVDTKGDDSSDGSYAHPLRTVQKALDTLGPGETAFVHGGAYPDPIS